MFSIYYENSIKCNWYMLDNKTLAQLLLTIFFLIAYLELDRNTKTKVNKEVKKIANFLLNQK